MNLIMQAALALKCTKLKLDLLNDIDILLMTRNSKTEGIHHSIYRYANAINKHMKDYDKIEYCHIFYIGM